MTSFINCSCSEIAIIWSINKIQFLKEWKTKAEECIFSEKHEDKDFVAIQASPLEILTRVIEHRRSPFYDELGVETVISEYPKLRSSKSPIMMEENYFLDDEYVDLESADLFETPNQTRPFRFYGKVHIFVLVHGLGGSQVDLLAFKNYISTVNPNAEFIISCKNSRENVKSESYGLDHLAENLASEIEADIEFHGIRNIEKVSFIGFSLGGIIIRAALPLLSKYKDKFFSYISLATPHLGVKLKKKYIAAGLWFMKMFTNSKLLEQLNLEDSEEIADTYLYKLSKSEGLSWFRKVHLFSSSQDTYAPFGSWRIQIFNDQILDNNYSPEILEMAENILLRLKWDTLTRVNANFYLDANKTNISEAEKNLVSLGMSSSNLSLDNSRRSIKKIFSESFDKMIGRKAHTEFITNYHFAEMLVHRYKDEIFCA